MAGRRDRLPARTARAAAHTTEADLMGRAVTAAMISCALVVGLMTVFVTVILPNNTPSCGSNDIQNAAAGTAPSAPVRLVQANLKISEPDHQFAADLANLTGRTPDFVTLNEVNSRTDAQITPAGYGMWRPSAAVDGWRSPVRETAVLWRTDTWTRATQGSVRLTRPVTGAYDRLDWRYATWVTLRSVTGQEISVVSAHTMTNPRVDHGTLRKYEDQAGFRNLAWLTQQLQKTGPVIAAGDLNASYPRNGGNGPEWWGPKPILAAVGMVSTFQTLGMPPAGWATHDAGGTVDWIFYQAGALTPTGENTFPLHSDHRGLWADFTTEAPAGTSSTPPANQTLTAVNLPTVSGFDSEQLHNAAAVIAAGQELGAPTKAIAIALMTAIGESELRVLDHGDAVGPDSRGLFQQRANGAWGSLADRMDPRISSLNFLHALLAVPSWQDLPPTIAAHRTQHNADPNYYTTFWPDALRLLAALTGSSAVQAILADGTTAACDTLTNVAYATDAVVWPVPANMADTDEHNFGRTGDHWASFHTGTDFAVPCGTPVYATTSGTIILDHTQAWAGPNLVKVQSGGPGSLTTWYAHMESETISNGQTATAGQQIGLSGAEGNTTGCHLHFEVHPRGGSIYQDSVNPSLWLARNLAVSKSP